VGLNDRLIGTGREPVVGKQGFDHGTAARDLRFVRGGESREGHTTGADGPTGQFAHARILGTGDCTPLFF